jgi:hypothetical protein
MQMFRKFPAFSPLLLVLLLLPARVAGGLEITANLQVGNLGFTTTRTSSDASFPGADLFWNGSASLVHSISDTFAVEGGYYNDLILRNVVYTQFLYRTDYLSVGIGTILGLFNTSVTPLKTGLTTTMRVELPGTAYVSVRSDASLGGDSTENGDYSMERTELALGFTVPNAICTLGMDSRRFAETEPTVETIDSLTDYSFKIIAFEKNVPFRLHFLFSWQNLRKTFRDNVTNPSAGVDSFIAGLGIELDLGSSFSLYAAGSSNIYSLGTGTLAGVSVLGFEPPLLKVEAGFTWNLDSLLKGSAPVS